MEKQLAYIAGVLDGEGTILVGKYPRKGNRNLAYRGFLAIGNTHVPLLQFIKGVIGGKIIMQKKSSGDYAGSICYSLSLTTNEIRKWLPELLPFLIVKKEQAEVLLAFLEKQANNASAPVSDELLEFYESCYQKLKALKKVRYEYREPKYSLGFFDCAQCGKKFERTSKAPKRIYCGAWCKKQVHWTRSNNRIRLGIPAWDKKL